MTRDEIMRLEGRELDIAICHRLVILTVIPLSTTWQGVGLVVKGMRAKGWRMRLETFDDFAEAEFCQPGLISSDGSLARDCKSARAVDKSAPRAVALAALMALEAGQ